MPSKKNKADKNRKGPASSSQEASAALLESPETKLTSTPSASSSSAVAAALLQPPKRASASSSTAVPRALDQGKANEAEVYLSAASCDDDEEDRLEALLAEPIELNEPPPVSILEKDATLVLPQPSPVDMKEFEALVGGSASDEEKVERLHEALQQRIEDVRNFEEHQMLVSRALEDMGKEKERLFLENKRSLASKAKLEDSCRELQGMKGTIIQETRKIVEEEQSRQNDLNEKFQQAMKDVEEKMEAEKQVREHFIKENEELRTKLQKFMETYEAQEKHLAEQVEVRAKEMQLAQERLKEYETKGQQSKVNAASLEKQNKALLKTTKDLREQLQSILGKFDDFQESVTGSNQRHGECKEEIDGLQSRFQELESENQKLRENVELAELTKQQQAATKQKQALEKLCENLDKECEVLRGRLSGATSGRGGG